MSPMFLTIYVLAAAACGALGAAPACGAGHWSDGATCKPCSTCGAKEVLLFPCSETRDVFCADAGFLRSIKPLPDSGGAPTGEHHRWHETEGGGAEMSATKRPRAEKSFWTAVLESHWNVVLAVALVAALAFVALALGVMVFRKCGPRKSSSGGSSPLSRFFASSSSTDYMHHLAMDELLDRKQRGGARYEPQRLHDNVYVDCAAIPRFEDRPDYSRSLLRLRDDQQ